MENKRILVTGYRGFLCSRLIEELIGNEFIRFGGDVREHRIYTGIDVVMHFASPSQDIEFADKPKTATTIIDGTLNMLSIAKQNHAKFIFASTLGVYHAKPHLNSLYESSKLAMDNYIQGVYNNYVILRIPRVYSANRPKGLMRKLREHSVPEKDMKCQLDFITLDEFAKQTLPALDRVNVVHEYTDLHSETIGQIKTRFNI